MAESLLCNLLQQHRTKTLPAKTSESGLRYHKITTEHRVETTYHLNVINKKLHVKILNS